MRRALASIRFSPADRPRLASRPARSRTTSTTWTRSPDASFSRFALYRCDQSRPSSPPPGTVTPQPISKLPGSLSQRPKLVPRMTVTGHAVMPLGGTLCLGRGSDEVMAEADEGGASRPNARRAVLAPPRVCPLLARVAVLAIGQTWSLDLPETVRRRSEASEPDSVSPAAAVGGRSSRPGPGPARAALPRQVNSGPNSSTASGCPGQPAMATGIQPDGSGSASRRSRNAMRVKPYAIRFPSRNAHHTALPAPGGWISTSGCSCRYRSSLRTWSGRPGGTSCTGQYRHPASGQRNGFPKSPAPCHHRYGYECRRALVRPSKRRLNAGLDLPHFWACSSHRAQSKTRSTVTRRTHVPAGWLTGPMVRTDAAGCAAADRELSFPRPGLPHTTAAQAANE